MGRNAIINNNHNTAVGKKFKLAKSQIKKFDSIKKYIIDNSVAVCKSMFKINKNGKLILKIFTSYFYTK